MGYIVQYPNGAERTFQSKDTAASEADRHDGSIISTGDGEVDEISGDGDGDDAADQKRQADAAEAARQAETGEQKRLADEAAAQQQQQPQIDPVSGLPLAT